MHTWLLYSALTLHEVFWPVEQLFQQVVPTVSLHFRRFLCISILLSCPYLVVTYWNRPIRHWECYYSFCMIQWMWRAVLLVVISDGHSSCSRPTDCSEEGVGARTKRNDCCWRHSSRTRYSLLCSSIGLTLKPCCISKHFTWNLVVIRWQWQQVRQLSGLA